MNQQLSKSAFKAKALEYFRQIEDTGESVIVTDHGKPVVEVRAVQQSELDPLAILKGTVVKYEQPFEPIEDWNLNDKEI
jgi:antitoxin (DNA-binding transcriptional repressor) of toxin-antitoxin stability system